MLETQRQGTTARGPGRARSRVGRVRRTAAAVAASAALAGAALAGAPAAQAAGCATPWGSLPKEASRFSSGTIGNIRGGRHACYDRLVVDVDGDVIGYRVSYVNRVRDPGSGDVVPVRGGARLQVMLDVPAHDADYRPTYRPPRPSEAVDVARWETSRQVVWGGTYEAQSLVGLGVRARLPFRAFVLDGPGPRRRFVLDVAHSW